jgi:hypothetical protein
VIVELTEKCFRTLEAAARVQGGTCTGLLIRITRADFRASPRILRCEQRVPKWQPWPYDTRRELARIWGIAIRPRLFKEA